MGEETLPKGELRHSDGSRPDGGGMVGEMYEFGPFRLDPAERRLWRGDEVIALTPKTFDTLLALVRHIWGEQYSRKASDLVVLQGEIAREMTRALRVRLTGEDEKRLAKGCTANPEAYHDYLKGRYWLNKSTEAGISKCVEYFRQAIVRDPGYALAYSGLSDCHTSLARDGFVPAKEGYLTAKEAALKALEIDGTLAEAHVSLAYIKIESDWDWPAGARESQRAVALNPSYAPAYDAYAESLWLRGRLDDGIAESKRALELDPLSLASNDTLGIEFFLARRYSQAIEQEGKTLELDPSFHDEPNRAEAG